jgi:hypothetical protein
LHIFYSLHGDVHKFCNFVRMLKRVIVYILLTCVISTYLSRDFAVASFELNQKYIAEKLCVNKNKPWMHCNGRCYLLNKVKQAEENEQKQASKELRSNLQINWYFEPLGIATKEPLTDMIARSFKIHYTSCYTNQFTASIFRPPKSAA